MGTSNNYFAFPGILIKIRSTYIASNIIIKYVKLLEKQIFLCTVLIEKFVFKISYDFSCCYTLERIIRIDYARLLIDIK